ncbi:MAG: FecR family protein [Burkholderiaceae bacterium]
MKHSFKPKNAALLMALAAIYPLAAHSAAGVAQFAIGDVHVRRGATSTPLSKGQAINTGDNIITGTAGQTQIRFTDGGLVSLAPNSQFNIDKYADENDPGKDSFALNFLRGGLRAITGLIGKRNHDNYRVTTTTATIGIRGSAFSANLNPDGTLNVADEQDGIVVCTNAGCVNLTLGEVVRVVDGNTLPQRTALRSNVPPLVAREALVQPDSPLPIQRGAENNVATQATPVPPPVLPPPVLPPPPEQPPQLVNGVLNGVSAMFAFGSTGSVDSYPRGGQDPSDGQGTFVEGQMVRHVGTASQRMVSSANAGSPSHSLSGGTLATVEKVGTEPGTFGTIGKADDPAFMGWGYWDAGKITGELAQTLSSSSDVMGVHYIVGLPAPQAQIPISGSANYSLLGGTAPTAYDGSTLRIGSLLNALLNVDFGASRVNGVFNTAFAVAGQSVPVQIAAFGYVDGSTFYSDGVGSYYYYGSGSFSGFFSGDQASRAGLVYAIHDATVGDVRGSAVFLKDGSGQTFSQQSGVAGLFTSSGADGSLFDDSARYQSLPSPATAFFEGKQLYLHDAGDHSPYGGDSTITGTHSAVSSFGALGEVADADFVGWGYWAQGEQWANYGGSSSFAGLHYLVGRPTPAGQMPVTGTAQYALAGGTPPTAYDSDSGVFRTGQLVSAGLNADFTNARVNAFINTRFTMADGPVSVAIGGSGTISGSWFESHYSESNGQYSGFFSGAGAGRAGLIYQAQDDALGYVQGAAGFQSEGAGDAFTSQSNIGALFVSGDGGILDLEPRGGSSPYGGTASFVGKRLTSHDDNGDSYFSGPSTVSAASPVSSSGGLGNPGDSDFIGWGYWTKGAVSGPAGSPSLADVHYLVGRPTSAGQMPVTGTASYTLAGGTAPTATLNGTSVVGSLMSAGTGLSVNFSANTVDATINTQFTKNSAVVNVSVTDHAFISGSTFLGSGCAVSGFFAGNQATRAGLIYNKFDAAVGAVSGAAVFQKAGP